MAKNSKKMSKGLIAGLSVAGLIFGFALGAVGSILLAPLPDSYEIPDAEKPSKQDISGVTSTDFTVDTIISNELSIHFMELGNKYTGDSTLIKVGNTEVLIDAGSKSTSVEPIYNYAKNYVTDGVLEYIIVTHAHEDHYAGFSTSKYEDSLFSKFNVGKGTKIIDFAKITKGKENNRMYKNYQANLKTAENKGAKHYTCAEALTNTDLNNGKISLGNDVTLNILETKYYTSVATTENNHSVCTLINQGTHNYLLTGDLEKDGEESLVSMNPSLPVVDLYKAGHHGSKTSSSEKLMEKIKPKHVAVCCCAGSSEYTKTDANQFPTQEFVDRVALYTDKIYVTTQCINYDKGEYQSMNGNIIITCNKDDDNIKLYFSNNSTLLKDTDWFNEHRIMPENWK